MCVGLLLQSPTLRQAAGCWDNQDSHRAVPVVINAVERDVDRGSDDDDTAHRHEGLCKNITLIHTEGADFQQKDYQMQRAWGQWGVALLQGHPVVQLISPGCCIGQWCY